MEEFYVLQSIDKQKNNRPPRSVNLCRISKKNDVFLLCDEEHAQGIMSSDMNDIWHVDYYPSIDKEGVDTVSLIEIDKYEYEQLKPLCMKTPEEIIDAYTLTLLNGGGL